MNDSKSKDGSRTIDKDTLSFIRSSYEKVCQAAFAITAHIKDTETVRISIRDTAVQLRVYIQSIPDESTVFGYGIMAIADTAKSKTLIICGVLDLALAGGLITKVNHQYFISECHKIINSVADRIAQIGWDFGELMEMPASLPAGSKVLAAKHPRQEAPRSKTTQSIKDKSNIRDIKDNRNDKIVSYINSNGRVSIQDIHRAIPDTGTKTIQRALNVLIKEGRVKRFGDKRWALYYI